MWVKNTVITRVYFNSFKCNINNHTYIHSVRISSTGRSRWQRGVRRATACPLLGFLTYLLTYLLTYSIQQSPSWEANRFSASQKFPAFYGTLKFITAFTSARHLSLSWANSIQSVKPHPTSWRSILILTSHLRHGLPSDLFPSGFPTKTLHTPRLFPIRATRPVYLILLDLITRTICGEEHRSYSSPLCK